MEYTQKQFPLIPPTVGRIVLYVPEPDSPEAANHATVVPAIVSQVFDSGLVNLRVFCNSADTTWVGSVHYDSSNKPAPRTWHWPPRV